MFLIISSDHPRATQARFKLFFKKKKKKNLLEFLELYFQKIMI